MAGRHTDTDGDGIADQGLSDPFADRQHAAFAEAGPDELVTDEGIAAMYESGELRDVTEGPTADVDEHEAAGWDTDRIGPKSPQEARDALAARVADPGAPDTDPRAYDDL